MGWSSALLRRGPESLGFWWQGTMLKVAPVSTKYLLLVNSSVRNIKPAFAGKCIAVAVACVEKAVELKGVLWRISFPTKYRAECTCYPYWHRSCEICTCHCQGFEKSGNLGGKGVDFWGGHYRPFCRLSSRCWEQGSCFAASRRLRP